MSESHLQTISAVGAGLLIGTALGVILPEGSEAFGTARQDGGKPDESVCTAGTQLAREFARQCRLPTKHRAVL